MTLVEPAPADTPDMAGEPDLDPEVVAAEIGNVGELKRKSKVRAFTPLPGVPEGTAGLVTLVNGWDQWIRYRVLFENGMDVGNINRWHLAPTKQYDELVEKRRKAIESGAFEPSAPGEAAAGDGDGEAAAAGGGGGAVVNGVSIPQHLLDRSAAARARLAG